MQFSVVKWLRKVFFACIVHTMYKETVIKYFGSQTNVADELDLTRQAVQKWDAVIPAMCALELDFITDGKLAFDKTVYFRAYFRKQEDDLFI